MTSNIRIFIADDHELVREGIKARLSLSPDMQICGEAANGKDAVLRALECDPDVIFLDISMPEKSGLVAAEEILIERPDSKIIFLSIYDNPEYVNEALRIGAKGYLLKDISQPEMDIAVKAIFNGGTYLGSKITQDMGQNLQQGESDAFDYHLSGREKQVLVEVANGSRNKAIAEKLNISVRTVESHRLTLREKTGCDNAVELYQIASKLGLV